LLPPLIESYQRGAIGYTAPKSETSLPCSTLFLAFHLTDLVLLVLYPNPNSIIISTSISIPYPLSPIPYPLSPILRSRRLLATSIC